MISHQLWIKISCNSLKTIARRSSLGQSKLKVIFSTFNLSRPNKVELFNFLHFFFKLKKKKNFQSQPSKTIAQDICLLIMCTLSYYLSYFYFLVGISWWEYWSSSTHKIVIIQYFQNTMIWCFLLSHKWWVSLIKFIIVSINHVRALYSGNNE